jgi:adenosylcobinamide-phosphate synthase
MLIVLLCALLLDYFLGEFNKYHPLVAFGQLAEWLEEGLNEDSFEDNVELSSEFILEPTPETSPFIKKDAQKNRLNGFLAAMLCLVPAGLLTHYLISDNLFGYLLEIIILYFAIGLNSLKRHAHDILLPLVSHQLEQARHSLSMIVSRDTRDMDEEGICRATTESVLENGNDAVFATIFWFIIAGAPGVIIFRLTNTLDAMWGYKTERYNDFGFFVAKFDDILNYIPSRLTALSYALMGNWKNAMQCWSKQGSLWESPNAGVVMAAGAGALDVQLGGGDHYHGEYKLRPDLGCGAKATPQTIKEGCELLDRSTLLWIIVVTLVSVPSWL